MTSEWEWLRRQCQANIEELCEERQRLQAEMTDLARRIAIEEERIANIDAVVASFYGQSTMP